MGLQYKFVTWTPFKKRYDIILFSLILVYALSFIGFHLWLHPEITAETLIIRLTGSLSFILLHLILWIGPMTRINSSFLPLLYNRRHLGVITFFISLIHGVFNLIQFHALGNTDILNSLFTSNTHYGSIIRFPFQSLGFLALCIFAILAFTSHDFWLSYLSPKVWKRLHRLIYVAYIAVVGHVFLGIVQLEDHPFFWIATVIGFLVLALTHFLAYRSRNRSVTNTDDDWVKTFSIHDITDNRAKITSINGQSVAVFKYDGQVSAVINRCRHQNGPLGEGKIIDGCITCPWHGYQYWPHNGQSPPPFSEKIETFEVKIENDMVYVRSIALPPGTEVIPAKII